METYDLYVKKLAELVDEWRRQGHAVQEFDGTGDPQAIIDALPLRVGPGAQKGIILRRDTYAELGSPSAGSCAFVMWTTDSSLVRDGRVTLVGPDIPEAASGHLPLGQIVIVGGRGLGMEDQSVLEQKQYIADLLEGYMVKSAPGRVWTRVSKAAAEKGLNFEMLGRALQAIYKRQLPQIESIETLFVTTGKDEIKQLEGLAAQVRVLGKAFRRDALRAQGFDLVDCTMGTDCKSCEVKIVCDDIRDVVRIRKRRDRKPKPWVSRKRSSAAARAGGSESGPQQ